MQRGDAPWDSTHVVAAILTALMIYLFFMGLER